MPAEIPREPVDELRVVDVRPVRAVVAEHERHADHGGFGSSRDLGEPGPVEAGVEDRDLVGVAAPAAHGDRCARTERARSFRRRGLDAQRRRDEPLADRRQLGEQPLERPPGREPVVLGERGEDHPEGRHVVALVLEDAREHRELLGAGRELDQPPVRQLRGRLEHDVEVAVALEGLVPELGLQRGRHAPHRTSRQHEESGRAGPQRRAARVQEVAGRGDPAREHALDLASVDDERREPFPAGQQRAADVGRVQLLVLPDPHQGLADECPDLGIEVERVDPCGHRLLPVRDRDDLLALEGEQPEQLALLVRVVGVLGPPLGQLRLDLLQQVGLEITHAALVPPLGEPRSARGRMRCS